MEELALCALGTEFPAALDGLATVLLAVGTMLRRRARWPLRPIALPLAPSITKPYIGTALGERAQVGVDLSNGLRVWVPLWAIEGLERSFRQASGHGQRMPLDATGDDALTQRGNDLAPLGFELVYLMLHADNRTVVKYGASRDSSGSLWQEVASALLSLGMREPERVRAAFQRYIKQHGIKPHRWSLDAGLSERALPHFLDGTSKSMRPESLIQLARARQARLVDILGFVPDFTEEAQPAGETSPQVMELMMQMAEDIRRLREQVERLTEAVAAGPPDKKP